MSRSAFILFTLSALGMTTANLKLVILGVTLEDLLETPVPKLDVGEFIVTRVIEIAKLNEELKGKSSCGFPN